MSSSSQGASSSRARHEEVSPPLEPPRFLLEPVNELSIARFISDMERRVNEQGIRLELMHDFDALLELSRTIEDRAPLTPMFNPELSDVGPANGFWIKGMSPEGECVHLQAMRVDDFTGSTLHAKLESLEFFYRSPRKSAALGESCRCFAPAAKHITGLVCYHGELWLKGGKNGYRGRGLGTLLPRIALAIGFRRWQPDYIYAFPWPAIAWRGLLTRYGYMHMQPYGHYWQIPGQPLDDSWLAWMTPQDLAYLIQLRP